MKLNRANLVESLEKVLPFVGENVLVPEYRYIMINGEGIQATNGTMVIDTKHSENTGLNCGVPGESFLSLLRSLQEEDIELEDIKGVLKVRTSRLEGSFTVLKESKFIETSLDEQEKIPLSPGDLQDLIDGLSLCKDSVSKDETTGAVCGVRVEGNTLFGTDRYRVSKYILKNSTFLYHFSLPIRLVDILIKNRGKIEEVYHKSNEQLTTILKDGTYISSLLLTGEYPDLLQYFSISPDFFGIIFKEGIQEVLERHISFIKEVNILDKEIKVSVDGQNCVLSSANPRYGGLIEEVELLLPAPKATFLVDPFFLRDVVDENCNLKYYLNEGIVLVDKGQFCSLIQTRK